jgi:hypothetical protein
MDFGNKIIGTLVQDCWEYHLEMTLLSSSDWLTRIAHFISMNDKLVGLYV